MPAALAGLASYPQFVLYRLEPSQTKPGKTDKRPVHWRTGYDCNLMDPQNWTTFDNALAQVRAGVGNGVGFVFQKTDPFFFLDIDNAWIDATEDAPARWSDTAQYLCSAFPGAAVEVSSSGRGLHIIGTGSTTVSDGHACKNRDLGLEFYTQDRFVALTGVSAIGDVRADMSAVLPWLVTNYFAPKPDQPGAALTDWTDEPRADWRGPTDDADLLRRALQSRSAASVLSGKATFADLWDRNVDVLATAYPDSTREFNESDVDAALASHLAFWTGCNMERMETLMRQSQLVRSKWDERRPLPTGEVGNWLQLTIVNSCRAQRDVCRDREVQPPEPVAPMELAAEPTGVIRTDDIFLNPSQQTQFFAGCVYVQELHRVLAPSGALLRPEQFKVTYGGHVFVMDANNEKTSHDAFEAFTQSKVNRCPMAEAGCFRPDLPPRAIMHHDGRRLVNTYTPIDVPRLQGDLAPFLNHLARIIPDDRDRAVLLAYMAAVVQHKGVKFQWAPFIQGAEGNGKTVLSRCVAYAVGERYTHWPRADQISAKFNAWIENRIFIGVEDVYTPEDHGEVLETLKPMITNDRQAVEAKGVDQRSVSVCANFILNSNHKDGLRKSRNDRRIAPFFCPQQSREDVLREMGDGYFQRLYAWLRQDGFAIVAEYLNTYAIPYELNPAAGHEAPLTSSTGAAIHESLGGVEQEIMEAVENGTSGFMGGWISSLQVNRLLERLGRSRSLTPRKREKILADLGYVKHPALVGGRANNPVLPDGGKPVLFVRRGSPEAGITRAVDAERAYSIAQQAAMGS